MLHGYGYGNTRTDEFVDIAIEAFLKESGKLRPEGLLPKLAFFAATIEELTSELPVWCRPFHLAVAMTTGRLQLPGYIWK